MRASATSVRSKEEAILPPPENEREAAGFNPIPLSRLAFFLSGAEGDRTPDLLTASQVLSQLSYCPGVAATVGEDLCPVNSFVEVSAGLKYCVVCEL